jgi:hypothetical protein
MQPLPNYVEGEQRDGSRVRDYSRNVSPRHLSLVRPKKNKHLDGHLFSRFGEEGLKDYKEQISERLYDARERVLALDERIKAERIRPYRMTNDQGYEEEVVFELHQFQLKALNEKDVEAINLNQLESALLEIDQALADLESMKRFVKGSRHAYVKYRGWYILKDGTVTKDLQ